jgi:hypothetical protein
MGKFVNRLELTNFQPLHYMSINFEKISNVLIFQCYAIAPPCNETICEMTLCMAIIKTNCSPQLGGNEIYMG